MKDRKGYGGGGGGEHHSQSGKPGARTLTQRLASTKSPRASASRALAEPAQRDLAGPTPAIAHDDPFGLHLLEPRVPLDRPIQAKKTNQAAAPATKATGTGSLPVAVMVIEVYDGRGQLIASRSIPAHDPVSEGTYEATRDGGAWRWADDGGKDARVDVEIDEHGKIAAPGQTVESWVRSLPRGGHASRIVIHVLSEQAAGSGHGDGGADPDSTTNKKPRNGPVSVDTLPDALTSSDGDGQHAAPSDSRDASTRSPTTPAATTDDGDGTAQDNNANGADLDEAEADAFDQALDEEIAQLLEDLDQDDGGGDGPDGRSGDDTRPDGRGTGGPRAERGGGQHGGPDHNLRGADVAGDQSIGGITNPTAPTAGRIGGETGGSATGGVRGGSGLALFGITIAIPESLAGAVELALILEDANITGFGIATVRKAAQEATEQLTKRGGAAAVRSVLKRKASEAVAQRMRTFRKELSKALSTPEKQLTRRQRQIRKQWSKLSRANKARAMRITAWEMQRRYFDETLKAARAEAKQLRKQIRRTKDLGRRAALQDQLTAVDQLADAAHVRPIAGRLPIGHRYAGKDFPREKLPKRYQAQGLRIDSDGFPEFEPYALTLPNGKKSVRIEYTGGRKADFREANKLAGLDETPEGYVWHHHQRLGEMILIPDELHDAVKHSGGVAVHKHTTGAKDYGN